MPRAVIYRRQSLAKDGDELAIERQLRECQRVATARRMDVCEVITDNDISASKRGRPGYTRLIRQMESGQVDVVLILRIDRLLRLNDELEELIQLVEKHPVKVITVEGDIDLSTPQGRLVARILVSVARSEMEVKGARHRLANQQKAEAGLPHGARRPFGYEQDGLTIKEDEADVLRDIARKFLSGWSYNEIAYDLNAQGKTTTTGSPFYNVAIRQILQRKRYAGIREYNGAEYPAAWEPIYDASTWARIQHTIRERSENTGNRSMPRKYLLTGLLFCGECGYAMNGMTTRDRSTRPIRPSYRCRGQGRVHRDEAGCGKVSRGAVPLEHFIKELVVYRLDSTELARHLSIGRAETAQARSLYKERSSAASRLKMLVDDYADGTLSKPEFIRARGRAQNALERADKALAEVHRSGNLGALLSAGESVREAWDRQPSGWRRQLLGLLIERINVNAGRTLPRYYIDGKRYYFDANLIDIEWRA